MILDASPGLLAEPMTGRCWNAEQVRTRVQARFADYQSRGLKRGDRVFMCFGNCNEFFTDLLAIWKAGGCAVPIDARLTAFEVRTLAEWARPRFVAVLDGIDAALLRSFHDLGVEVVDASLDAAAALPAAPSSPGIRLDDDALILFTSGTTGQPKGVVHTHRSLLARWTSLSSHLGLSSFRKTLCLLPTHFGHGLICNSLFPWLSGCDLHVLPPFRPEVVASLGRIVDDYGITFMSSVPSVWRMGKRISRPPEGRTLERVFVGSAPLSATLWKEIREWCGTKRVVNSYGITETGSWLAGMTASDFEPEDGLIGEPWGGRLRVLSSSDPDSLDNPDAQRPPEESGHIWVKTPALMRGYLDRDDLTEKVVRDGWFLTGDIGVIDHRGWLHLRGREREEINKGGMKVYPSDIDSVIEGLPVVTDVCAFGYAEEVIGEDVGVAVVLSDSSDTALAEVFDRASLHLARHQLPRRWYVLDAIPRTSRGKINRAEVAAKCAGLVPVNMSALRKGAGHGGS